MYAEPVLVKQGTGSTFAAVSRRDIEALILPLPPLAEQHRIIAILDEAAELQRLRREADRRTAELVPAIFDEMFGERTWPQAFEERQLGELAEVVSGVTKGRRFEGRQTVLAPYLRVANVQAGYIDLREIKTIEALPEDVVTYRLEVGDVLLTEGGDYDKLGRGAMLDRDLGDCIHQNHVFRVRVDRTRLEPVFFAKLLLSQKVRAYFLSCAKRTTNLASINMRQLRSLPVLLPPLSLQKEFSQRVAEIAVIEAAQTKSSERLELLSRSLLERAFRGDLA